MQLKSKKKYTTKKGYLSTRSKSSEDTVKDIIPILKNIVTRISDITHMDKLHMPNYSAILPGTEDIIWVYSGKGPTKVDAKASALMEAVERYSSLSETCHTGFIRGTYAELTKSYNVLKPEEVVEFVNPQFDEAESIIDFVAGFNLLTNESVLVPVQLALSRYQAEAPAMNIFPSSHTNGLASGNVIEEAVYQSLCEVVERDATSIADLCASSISYNILERIANSLRQPNNGGYPIRRIPAAERFVDDATIFPIVDISNFPKDDPVHHLIERFTNAGMSLLIKDITQKDIRIPTFVASCVEWVTHDYGYFAKGYGTHVDSKTALIRAVTELSQTRAVNIQGARDDLKKINYNIDDEIYKRKWAFMDCSLNLCNKSLSKDHMNTINFGEIETHTNFDILDDIKLILRRLKSAGLNKVIIVELTNPKIGIPVVRSIVPGLETFEVTGSIMGNRAKEYFRMLHSK